MRTKSKKGLVSSQKSVWFYSDMIESDSNLDLKSRYHYISETSMLIDDVQLMTLPVPRYSDKNYQIKLSTPDLRAESLILDAIDTQYERTDLTEAIYEFFQQCVGVMMAYGHAAYEIVYYSTEEGILDSFRIAIIPPSAFINKRGKYRQYVPSQVSKERGLEERYIDLPSEDILLFELPQNVKENHQQTMDSLAFLGQNLFPQFALDNLYNPTVPFSQSDYLLSREIALAKSTQMIGWNARNYNTEYKFEHYVWHRQLVFYRFICTLRQTILQTFNNGLATIGEKLSFKTDLLVDGLPTTQDVDFALKRLQEGDLRTFDEVLKTFR
jgi:hypothetical protein